MPHQVFLTEFQSTVRRPTTVNAQFEMNKYLTQLRNHLPVLDPLWIWQQRMPVYPRLAPLVQYIFITEV